jgi:endonuclease YncB( thermonuclease family)
MERLAPRTSSDEIDLYIRTYYSLLRSSGDVRVRAFEEAHLYSRSSLHTGAPSPTPDLAAFAYSAARLPECMVRVRRVVLGQSVAQFDKHGFDVASWQQVRTRGRRRPLRWDDGDTLAVFVASASDIDDLVPIVAAYQIEWNKLRTCLQPIDLAAADNDAIAAALDAGPDAVATLRAALGPGWRAALDEIRAREQDLLIRLLDGSYREYQRSAQTWWRAIEPDYPRGRPVYFVSSNSHSLANLCGGYVTSHRAAIVDFLRRVDPEGIAEHFVRAEAAGDHGAATNILYYALRAFLHEPAGVTGRLDEVQAWDAAHGLRSILSPGRIDVDAQVITLGALDPAVLDERLRVRGIERLRASNALVINIDYPLGMAAYHHLTAVAGGVDEILGVYVMGKAATLNGRIGDVMIAKVVHDVHSANTYLVRNAFSSADVRPYLRYGTVLDNQKALTVRSAFLQNREYMDGFYRDGYTVMEMESGPYLSAVYETRAPQRHPVDEIVNLGDAVDFELGLLHYASDTPYSRRQSLLSKSLSFFGVESTYACAIAIARRIFEREIERLGEV